MILRSVEAGGAAFAQIREHEGPIVSVALHSGHDLRPGLERYIALAEDERLREEDPYTADMAPEDATLVHVLRSRFEVDCNRPRFRCVYRGPTDSWGLEVYRSELPDEEDRVSRFVHDAFYAAMFDELSGVAQRHERFVVLDLHSYNHRRSGPSGPVADPNANPEVNLGTMKIDRVRWSPVVDAFISGMMSAGFDVRENVKFGGGHLAHWVSEHFPQGCTLAVEFKKTYVDEWSGAVDVEHVASIRRTLGTLLGPLAESLTEVR